MTTRAIGRLGVGFVITISMTLGRGAAIAPVHAQDGASAALGTVTTIDVPGALNTFPFGINASDVIVGRYLVAGNVTHGFVRTAADEVCTVDYPGATFVMAGVTNVCTVDVPGANFTVASGINAQGDITGWYTVPGSAVRHGFLLRAGETQPIPFDPPGSVFTNAIGINERGDIVGRYCTTACQPPATGTVHGFLVPGGDFSNIQTIDVPGAIATTAFKLNARGQIAGGFQASDLTEQIFVLSHGELTAFAPPGGQPVSLDQGGINERGDIVGTYCDSAIPCGITLTGTHGFLLRAGEFTTIDVTGITGVTVKATSAAGINARGEIVGSYSDGIHFHGFVLSHWIYQSSTP
jgi:uncharacterized membrane protein